MIYDKLEKRFNKHLNVNEDTIEILRFIESNKSTVKSCMRKYKVKDRYNSALYDLCDNTHADLKIIGNELNRIGIYSEKTLLWFFTIIIHLPVFIVCWFLYTFKEFLIIYIIANMIINFCINYIMNSYWRFL